MPVFEAKGTWKLSGDHRCPAGLLACELDESMCVAPPQGLTPLASPYSRRCPMGRSGRSCERLREKLGFKDVNRSSTIAVDFCIGVADDLGTEVQVSQLVARQACENVGARLCRPSEVMVIASTSNLSQGTWSSEPCGLDGYWRLNTRPLAKGVGHSWACEAASTSASRGICCADRDVEQWPCSRDLPGHSCHYTPCSALMGPTHCQTVPFLFFYSPLAGRCQCTGTRCAHRKEGHSWECVAPTEPMMRSRARYKLVKEGHECASKGIFLGQFLTPDGCAEAVRRDNGTFFIWVDPFADRETSLVKTALMDPSFVVKVGNCYKETTKTRDCEEGFEKDFYDFYELVD
eukprot:TRINITY_DN912_c0_g1_i2.p1 TRINITY_DN912_c0_g1~~TRINITY_DN912_c0_g1_i2.p1  ORF type:complete len:347 (+),score=44.30 TRINITY_DN912_c0_g1_i2:1036-2076(+)